MPQNPNNQTKPNQTNKTEQHNIDNTLNHKQSINLYYKH